MKTVLITGASRGIGAAIAEKFAHEGYNTIINSSKSINDLLTLANKFNNFNGKCLPIQANVSNPHDVITMFQEIALVFPQIDIIINNAGISQYQLITDTSTEDWQQMIDTNLSSAFYICKAALPDMIRQKSGSIVNISSIWGTHGASMEVAYSTSKAGLNGFTKALAKEVGPSGIRVNALACGAIDTAMNRRFTSDEIDSFTEDIPLSRLGTTKEVAEMVYHMATSATYLNGEIIHYDGGY